MKNLLIVYKVVFSLMYLLFIIGDSGMLSKTKFRNKNYRKKKCILTKNKHNIVFFIVLKVKLNESHLVYICFLNKTYLG
jgi:hypothetical protein